MMPDGDANWPRWLLSPTGVLLSIRDLRALKQLCDDNSDEDMRLGNMKQLLGMDAGSSARQQYKYGWQEFQHVRWLTHPGLEHLIPVVEKPAIFFNIFKQRADAVDITEEGLFVAFVNGNLRKSVGRKKEKIALEEGRIGAAGWRVIMQPAGAEDMVPHAPQGSPFAVPQVSFANKNQIASDRVQIAIWRRLPLICARTFHPMRGCHAGAVWSSCKGHAERRN